MPAVIRIFTGLDRVGEIVGFAEHPTGKSDAIPDPGGAYRSREATGSRYLAKQMRSRW